MFETLADLFEQLADAPLAPVDPPLAPVEPPLALVVVWRMHKQKCLILKLAGGSFLISCGFPGAPRQPPEHHVEEVAKINHLFTKK